MTKTHRPGRKAGSTRTGRPIMLLLDLLGRRWALRVLWELRGEQRLTFRELREACSDVSPTVLNERIKELREAGLVDSSEAQGYGLSPLGRELESRFLPLVRWSERWARETSR